MHDRLAELQELLNSPSSKIGDTERKMIESEIESIKINLPRKHTPITRGTKKLKNRKYYKCMLKDKAKHGMRWCPQKKKLCKKIAKQKLRNTYLVPLNGSGYKKVYNVLWQLW